MRPLAVRQSTGAETATWRALGTYVYLATTEAQFLEPARQIATRLLADVDRTC